MNEKLDLKTLRDGEAVSLLREKMKILSNLLGSEEKALKFASCVRPFLEGRADADFKNVWSGVMMLAANQLYPMKGRNIAFFIPYFDGRKNVLSMQLGYQAFVELAARNGILINAQVVCKGDEFSFNRGTGEILHFDGSSRNEYVEAEILGAYATCLFQGSRKSEFLSKAEIDRHRELYAKKNKEGKFAPSWRNSFAEMAKKTVIIRLCKTLPMLEMPGLQEAINFENEANFEIKKAEPREVKEKRLALEEKSLEVAPVFEEEIFPEKSGISGMGS